MEGRYATEQRLVHASEQLWEDEDPWTFRLSSPQPCEDKYLMEADPRDLTKVALARLLELQKGVPRKRTWSTLSVAGVIAALGDDGDQ